MTTPKITVHNATTGEVIEREMNAEEIAQYEVDKAQALIQAEAEAAAKAQKQAILDRLGLTEDELRIVLG